VEVSYPLDDLVLQRGDRERRWASLRVPASARQSTTRGKSSFAHRSMAVLHYRQAPGGGLGEAVEGNAFYHGSMLS
jgi:hypothetical protein